MLTINKFYKLRNTEDYFRFFEIEFDQTLINVKRFHMMKEYGTLIRKGIVGIKEENKLLEFLKFSLLRVYGDYRNGHAPNAADVWDMYKTGKLNACTSCQGSNEISVNQEGVSCGC